MRLLSRGLFLGVALGCGVASTAFAVEKLSQKFSFQGVVTDVPDGAYTVDLEVVGGNTTHSFALTDVQFTNGVFTAMIDGAADSFMNPSLFYTSTGNGDIRVNIVVHLLGGNETFNNIPISSVANAWAANRAVTAAMADQAMSAVAVSGVTVMLPAVGSISEGAVLKFDATARRFVAGSDNNAGASISLGTGATQIPALNGSAKWDMGLLDTGTTNGKLLLVGSGDLIPDSVISTNIARTSGVATLTGGLISDSVIPSGIARTTGVATLTGGLIADSVIPSNIPRMTSGTLPVGSLPPITTTEISNGSIASVDLAADAVTSAKISDGTIVAADLAADAVTSAKISDGAIVAADLATDAVTSAKITDGTIVAADLADSAVTNAKLAAGTVNWDKLNLAGVTAQGKVLGYSDGAQLQWVLPTPLAAKGDILFHDGTSAARLPAYSGTNLYVLVSDQSSATGVRWMDPDDMGGHSGEGGNSSESYNVQRIESGSRNMNGYDFLTASGNDVALDATPTPVVVKIANGSNPVVGVTLTADLALTGLANGTNYIYLDVSDATGANPTLNYTQMAPLYESSCPTSGVATGIHCFDYNLRRMRQWSGSVWQDKYRIFLGWAVAAGGTIDTNAIGVNTDSPMQSGGGSGGRFLVTSNQYWVVPFAARNLVVEAWGGGGGGAGSCLESTYHTGGGGGGAGAYGKYLVSGLRGGQVIYIQPGQGGNGGTADDSSCSSGAIAGGNGGDTQIATAITSYLLAPGGKGGGLDGSGNPSSGPKRDPGLGAKTLPTSGSLGTFAQIVVQTRGTDGGWGEQMSLHNNGGYGGSNRLGGDGGMGGDRYAPALPSIGDVGGGGGGGYGGGTGSDVDGAAGGSGAVLISY